MRIGSAFTTRPPPQAASPGRGVMPTAYPTHTKVVPSRRGEAAVLKINLTGHEIKAFLPRLAPKSI